MHEEYDVISIMQARAAREAAAIAQARADQLVLSQADELRERDPTAAIAWLKQYPTAASWDRARDIVADASGRGVALHVLIHPRQISRIAFAADGGRLVTRQVDNAIRSWDVARRSFVDLPLGRDLDLIELSPDGTRLVATTTDRGVRVYDTASWRILATLAVGSRVVELAIARDNRVALATAEGRIELWDGKSTTSRHLGDHKEANTIAISPDGRTVASTGLDKRIVFWDLAGGPSRAFDSPAGISTLAYSPDGVFVAGTGWSVEVWKVATGERTGLDRPLWRLGTDLAWVDGKRIAFSVDSGDVHIWSPANGDLHTLRGHRVGIQDIAASEDGRTLVTAGDREVRVWSVPPSRRIARLRGTATDIPDVSDDCRFVASGDSGGNVTIWNTVSDSVFTLTGHTTWVNAISMTPDGKQLVSADHASVQLWDLETKQGRVIRTRTSGRLKWAKFLSNDRVAIVDNDELVIIDTATAAPTCRAPGGHYRVSDDGRTIAIHFDGHANNIMGVAFCLRGDFVVSSGFDGTLRMWPTMATRPRPADPVGLRGWLDTATTAEANSEGGLASPPR